MTGVISFVSHSAVEALSGDTIIELLEFIGEFTGLHQAISTVTPLSSTPMGGRNVGMLIQQQESFATNMTLQAQQQLGHLQSTINKSITHAVANTGGANSITMGGVNELGSSGAQAGSMAMPAAGALSGAAMSGIGGAGNAGSQALNQISSGVTQGASSVGQVVQQSVSQGAQQGSHQNGDHHDHKGQSHDNQYHGSARKTFSLKTSDSLQSSHTAHSGGSEAKPHLKVAVVPNPSVRG